MILPDVIAEQDGSFVQAGEDGIQVTIVIEVTNRKSASAAG
jgi:hypothetical protein